MLDNCKDCFNGCLERIPDSCVKYTGPDISLLGIKNGDLLNFVESQIFKYLLSIITGKGIKIDIENLGLCQFISSNLSINSENNLEDIMKALVTSICFIDTKIVQLTNNIDLLEADYDIKCLQGVTNQSNTHATLQSTINKVCEIQTIITALLNDLTTNYITSANINNYITNYNQTISNNNLISSKMIPYVAMPYFPTTAAISGNFDSSGAGIGVWLKIYLCNGKNSTPDLRGRTLVGATTGMAGDIITDSDVLPSVGNYPNPNYALKTPFGKNSITLNNTQVPNHVHTGTAISKDNIGHDHDYATVKKNGSATGAADDHPDGPIEIRKTNKVFVIIDTSVTINSTIGGGNSHNNIQPSIGTYYIMYIP